MWQSIGSVHHLKSRVVRARGCCWAQGRLREVHQVLACLRQEAVACLGAKDVHTVASERCAPFFFASQGVTYSQQGHKVSRGTCEMLRGGLQDFSSPSTSRRASLLQKKRKQGKSQYQGQYKNSWSKHALRGSCSQSCIIRFFGRPDQPRF